MDKEVTFAMIKPNATARSLIGAIIQILESKGLQLCDAKLIKMDKDTCETFYKEHKEKVFFNSLVDFILSGPVFVMALKGKDAILKTREIMGHTDPKKAKPGTIRALYGESIEKNSIHGSDSPASAKRELALFFEEY